MNERIQELISLCRDVDYIGIDETVHYSFNEEKFAELLVRECASAVNSRDDSDTGFWANIIKEHFGVKE